MLAQGSAAGIQAKQISGIKQVNDQVTLLSLHRLRSFSRVACRRNQKTYSIVAAQDPLDQIARTDDDHTTLHSSAKSLDSLGLHGPSNWFMQAKRFDGAGRGRTMLGKKKKGKGKKGKGNKDKDKDKKKGDKTKDKEKEGKGDKDQDKDKENKGDKDQDKDKENDDKTKGKGKEDECSAVSTKDACESRSDCMWDVGYGFMSPACARKGDSAKESEETGEGESSEEPEKKEEEPTTEMKEAAKDLTSCQQILCSQDPPITELAMAQATSSGSSIMRRATRWWLNVLPSSSKRLKRSKTMPQLKSSAPRSEKKPAHRMAWERWAQLSVQTTWPGWHLMRWMPTGKQAR